MFEEVKKILKPHKKIFYSVKFMVYPLLILREAYQKRHLVNRFIDEYNALDKSKPSIFYFGLPEHDNLGDIGQAFCINNWIKHNYPDYNLFRIKTRLIDDKKFRTFIKEAIKVTDIIFFQSGYCTRYKNKDHEMHKRICSTFYKNKLIILPQTVNISDQNDIMETKKIFARCEHLLFIARDEQSYKKAMQFVPSKKLMCFPDIVTSLIGRLEIPKTKTNGVLLCVRNDDEKFYSYEEIDELKNALQEYFTRVDMCDTNSDYTVEYTYEHINEVINEKIRSFSKYDVVITDRFHGTIFSLVANTPVIVVKTNDHKVTSGTYWFKSFEEDALTVSNSLNEAKEAAVRLYNKRTKVHNSDILYKQYYESKLKELVDNA